MNILKAIFGGGDAIKAIGEAVDGVFTSDEEKLERKVEMLKANREFDFKDNELISKQNIAQTEVNKADAAGADWFQRNWRPFSGWVCGLALAYSSIGEPFARFIAMVFFDYTGAFPHIDTTVTMQVLMGMLGIAGMRSYDKVKGTDTK